MVAGGDGGPVRVVREEPPGDIEAPRPTGNVEGEVPVRVGREHVRGRLEEEAGYCEGTTPRRLVERGVVTAGAVGAVGVGVDGEEVPRRGNVALEGRHVEAGLPTLLRAGGGGRREEEERREKSDKPRQGEEDD